MVQNPEAHIAKDFNRHFSELYSDKIQQLVHESFQEAFAQAKQILKERALNSVLTLVIENETDQRKDVYPKKHPSLKQEPGPKQLINLDAKEKTPHKPALSDRILEEIEAIREQILRNEELLSQIKPLIGLPKNATENT